MRFDFATAGEISFGASVRRTIGERARGFGSRALVVTGRGGVRDGEIVDALRSAGLDVVEFRVAGEPTVHEAAAAAALARDEHCELVIAIGGGSPIDLGKAAASLAANGGTPLDYVEVIGAGRAISAPSLPCIAVPTTAGAGAEVTRNAVLTAPDHGVKVSMRSPMMLPSLAIVDPELSRDLPPGLTAATGMDALTQLIEPFLSPRANPMTDGFCVDGIPRAARSLRRAFRDGQDLEARTDMALASLLGGLSLANAGLGAVHGFAAPIGGRFTAPHGAVCAALLPGVLRANLAALHARQPGAPVIQRFTTVARLLTGDASARADDGLAFVGALREDLGIPSLGHYGVTHAHLDDLVEAASRANSMRGNCIVLERGELRHVLEAAL